ncbi:MAG: DNA recombination protein RmuC, partial [Muribaculaceae bacterium]|nr:DNA recombination protein RmuC [Muribaculaceae bacterium]
MVIISVILVAVALAAIVYAVAADRRAATSRAEADAARNMLEITRNDAAAADERFRAIANEVLLANSRALDAGARRNLDDAIAPMLQRMKEMEKSFRDTYSAEARERFSLQDRVRELVELNRVVGDETRRLTDALKGNNRIQGEWGEIILENILERSGLQQGREYEVQQSVTAPDGRRLRPDVVVNYPDGRCVVVDSKVSVAAYLNMVDATDAA